jgi:hypothetical protein
MGFAEGSAKFTREVAGCGLFVSHVFQFFFRSMAGRMSGRNETETLPRKTDEVGYRNIGSSHDMGISLRLFSSVPCSVVNCSVHAFGDDHPAVFMEPLINPF